MNEKTVVFVGSSGGYKHSVLYKRIIVKTVLYKNNKHFVIFFDVKKSVLVTACLFQIAFFVCVCVGVVKKLALLLKKKLLCQPFLFIDSQL